MEGEIARIESQLDPGVESSGAVALARSRENAALLALRDAAHAQGVVPAEDEVIRSRAHHNEERLASVQSVDAAPVILGGLGLVAIGAGIWWLIDLRDDHAWQLTARASELELGMRYRW